MLGRTVSDLVQIELIHSLAQIVGTIVLAIPGLAAAYFSFRASRKVDAVHAQVEQNTETMNGHMAELLRQKGLASEAVGQQKERDRQEGHPHAE